MALKIMGLVVYSVAWADAYLRTKWHLDPSIRLATIDMGRKLGGRLLCPLLRDGFHLTQHGLGRRLPMYQ